jgi:hypothetical protein
MNMLASAMSRTFVRAMYGALAGSLGAACMTVIRMAARRRGIIEKTVPQAAEEWVADRTGLGRHAHPIVHHLADQGMHLAYGAALGIGYALTMRRRRSSVVARGAGYAVATWLGGSWLLLPLMNAKRAPWRKRASENAVDLVAHLVYGVATALVAEEMQAQPGRGPSSDQHRHAVRVG